MTCEVCGSPLTWGQAIIATFRVNRSELIEPTGYAHMYHFENTEEAEQ